MALRLSRTQLLRPTGLARSFNGSTDLVNCGTVAGIDGASKATLFCRIFRSSTGVTCGGGFTRGTVTGGDSRFSFIWYTDGNIYVSVENTVQVFASCALAGTGWHDVALVYDGSQAGNSTRLLFYIDGVAQALSFSGTVPATLGTVNPLTWGRDSADRPTSGVMADGAVWAGQVLSPGQVASLSKGVRPPAVGVPSAYTPLDGRGGPGVEFDLSPYRNNGVVTGTTLFPVSSLVHQRRLRDWWRYWSALNRVGAASGGNIYNLTLNETGSSSETYTALATFNPSLSETGASLDTLTPGVVYSTILVTESGSSTDTLTPSIAFNPSLAETGSGLDTLTPQVVYNPFLSESGSGLDTLTPAVTFNTTLGESGSASCTLTTGYFLTLTETGAAVDTPTVTVTFNPSIGEVGAALDSITPAVTFRPSLSESGSAQDTNLIPQTGCLIINETLSAQDTLTETTCLGPNHFGRAVRLPWLIRYGK